MHESSMAMSILDIVAEETRKAHAGAVHQVVLCVGELAGIEPVTLTACFDMLSEGTRADGAKLVIKRIPATGKCETCGAVVRRDGGFLLRCPTCAAGSVKLITGRELYVESIEVEQTQRGEDHVESTQ